MDLSLDNKLAFRGQKVKDKEAHIWRYGTDVEEGAVDSPRPEIHIFIVGFKGLSVASAIHVHTL